MRTGNVRNMMYQAVGMLLLMNGSARALNMTVQVTVTPFFSLFGYPTCSVAFMEEFQVVLTALVILATTPTIPDFTLEGGLLLVYRNTGQRRRALRASGKADKGATVSTEEEGENDEMATIDEKRELTTTTTLPKQCSSAGCLLNYVNGKCLLCSSSRRLVQSNSTEMEDDRDIRQRELYSVNFATLGSTASSYVQKNAQAFVASHPADAQNCLGPPLLLSVNVAYLVGQTFNPTAFPNLFDLLFWFL